LTFWRFTNRIIIIIIIIITSGPHFIVTESAVSFVATQDLLSSFEQLHSSPNDR